MSISYNLGKRGVRELRMKEVRSMHQTSLSSFLASGRIRDGKCPGDEMVDMQCSERCARKGLGVRVSPWAQIVVK